MFLFVFGCVLFNACFFYVLCYDLFLHFFFFGFNVITSPSSPGLLLSSTNMLGHLFYVQTLACSFVFVR